MIDAILTECLLIAPLNVFRCLRHSVHALANWLRIFMNPPVALLLLIHSSPAHMVARQLDLVKLC